TIAGNAKGKISIEDDGVPLTKNINLPATGGEKKWQPIEIKKVSFNAGVHHLRFIADKGGFNLKEISF
ncbi:MAG: hypothetical protein JWM28_4426, partial [Chitinophagaceae bacterium]|nr:hypothetical protein [Chitinophagaceae bacterium]